MTQLRTLAATYIERSKASLLTRYYRRHSEGAVILYFNRDGSLYKDSFLTKSELQFATMLPRNAYSEAQEYWINNPEQLIFLSWFYPITPGASFNVYCLGTVIKTFNTSTYNQPPVYSEPSSYTPTSEELLRNHLSRGGFSEADKTAIVTVVLCGAFFLLILMLAAA